MRELVTRVGVAAICVLSVPILWAQSNRTFVMLETNATCRDRPDFSAPLGTFHVPLGAELTFRATAETNGTVWYGDGGCWVPASTVTPVSADRQAVLLAILDRILNRSNAQFDEYVEVDNLRVSHRYSSFFNASPLLQLRRLQVIDRAVAAANAAGQSYSQATRTFDDYPPVIKAWLFAHRDMLSNEVGFGHFWFSRADPYWQLYVNASTSPSAAEILRAAVHQTLANISLRIAGGCFDTDQLRAIRAGLAAFDFGERDQLLRWSNVVERNCAPRTDVPETAKRDRLIDALVLGLDIDVSGYSSQVRPLFDKALKRSQSYRSKRKQAGTSGLDEMVNDARVRYERMLVSMTENRQAPELALAYVTSLGPCYEWEGTHACPEAEASFATDYQATHPDGPFSEYLPLLTAHRWLCANEAYDGELKFSDADRTRRAYEQALATAQRSSDLLIRTAADELAKRGRCFE